MAKSVQSMMSMWRIISVFNFIFGIIILVLSLLMFDFWGALDPFCPDDDAECEEIRKDAVSALKQASLYAVISAGIPFFLAIFGFYGSGKRSKALLGMTLFFTLVGMGMNIWSVVLNLQAAPPVSVLCDMENTARGVKLLNVTAGCEAQVALKCPELAQLDNFQRITGACGYYGSKVKGVTGMNIVCAVFQLVSWFVAYHFYSAGEEVWAPQLTPAQAKAMQNEARWWRRSMGLSKVFRHATRNTSKTLGFMDPTHPQAASFKHTAANTPQTPKAFGSSFGKDGRPTSSDSKKARAGLGVQKSFKDKAAATAAAAREAEVRY